MPEEATETARNHRSKKAGESRQSRKHVKQIAQAYESNHDNSRFMVDGVDVNKITLVGMVFDKADRSTDVKFNLDDGTGVISCQKWVHVPVDYKEMEAIQERMYVRLYGNLKGFQGKKHFLVFGARIKEELPSEVTHRVQIPAIISQLHDYLFFE